MGPDLNLARRAEALERLARQQFDLVVVGGGIVGCGVALDAAARGLRVALVERDDLAGGTSSGSTKLVHGGIRYLPQGEIGLVREGLVERGRLRRLASHLVSPLELALPVYAGGRPFGLPFRPPWPALTTAIFDLGLGAYDLLAGRQRRAFPPHRRLRRADLLAAFPRLRPERLAGGLTFSDGQTDDARLTIAVARTAARCGAAIATRVEAVELGLARRRVDHLRVRDRLGGAEIRVATAAVVNATGVAARAVAEQLAGAEVRADGLALLPSKGVHIVLARQRLGLGEQGLVLPETDDRRLLFVLPWLGYALVGTTDTPYTGDLAHPLPEAADIAYLLDHLNRYLDVGLGPGDVLASFAALRPLLDEGNAGQAPAALSRGHTVVEGPPGCFTVAGGKLTTYRRMAEEVVDAVLAARGQPRRSPTARLPLVGAEPRRSGEADPPGDLAGARLEARLVAHLQARYGSEAPRLLRLVAERPDLAEPLAPGLPFTGAEVVFAARAEAALGALDVLRRRVPLAALDLAAARAALPAVVALLARELGWGAEHQAEQERGALATLARAEAWRGALHPSPSLSPEATR